MQELDTSGLRTDGRTDADSLLDAFSSLKERVNHLELQDAKKDQQIAELEAENQELRDEIDELREYSAQDRAEIRKDVENVREEAESSGNPEGKGREDIPPETKIEQLAQLPDDILDDELHENQQRAVHVARRIMDYAKSTPAGRVIDAAAIREVLREIESESTHTQTVGRIRDFLVKFGEGTIEQVERRGKQLLAVDDDLAQRLGARSCDRTGAGGVA